MYTFKTISNITFMLIIILSLTTCSNNDIKLDNSASTPPDYWPTIKWRTSTPEKQGIRSELLVNMFELIKQKKYSIDNITIVRNGYVVTDAYFHPYKKNKKHLIYSCTKSVTSALIGIAVDKGYIKSVKQSVLSFFPDKKITNVDENKKKITLENLLTMTSGLKTMDSYLYNYIGLQEFAQTKDWTQYILSRPMDNKPGTKYEYSNGVSFLLTAILQKTTKTTALSFAQKNLFKPLGIKGIKWPMSPQGINYGWGDMWLSPHDMAKFGLLYLNKGKWDGKQIISESWVKDSIIGHIKEPFFTKIFDRYGYQWRIDDEGYYMAAGRFGQFIFVVPQKNMIVVFTSDLDGSDFFVPRNLLNDYIIPSAVSSKPLADNSTDYSRLSKLLVKFSTPPAKGFIWVSEKDGAAKNNTFIRKKSPAFKFNFPECSKKLALDAPNQIMSMKTPTGITFQASVIDIPAKVSIADFGSKFYAKALMKYGKNVKVVSSDEIELDDGNDAYETKIQWIYNNSPLETLLLVVYKDNKCILLTAHHRWYVHKADVILESLTLN